MNRFEFFANIHKTFKKKYIDNSYLNQFLGEMYAPKSVREFECYFRLRISGREDKTLEEMLIFIRGINGVTIVRSSDTTKQNEQGNYSTVLYIKYTPETFSSGVTLEDAYRHIEQKVRELGDKISLTRLSAPPGELVVKKGPM